MKSLDMFMQTGTVAVRFRCGKLQIGPSHRVDGHETKPSLLQWQYSISQDTVLRPLRQCRRLVRPRCPNIGPILSQREIMANEKSDLVFVQGNCYTQGYINQVLRPVAVPFFNAHSPATLLHDNARPHKARLTKQVLMAVELT